MKRNNDTYNHIPDTNNLYKYRDTQSNSANTPLIDYKKLWKQLKEI